MPLNIKNEQAHTLARELSELTNSTITEAVILALRETLDRERRRHRLHHQRRVEELNRVARECAGLPVLDHRYPDEILGYDHRGIPS